MVENSIPKIKPKVKTIKELSEEHKYFGEVKDFIIKRLIC
jgi:hypothetical protein